MSGIIKLIGVWKGKIGYLNGLLTTIAAIFIITGTVQEKLRIISVNINYGILIILCILLAIVASIVIDKIGLMEAETEYQNSKNPMLKEIHGKMK